MNKIKIRLKVDSTRDAEKFYCEELQLFNFHNDYGMGTISLVSNDNPSFFLILSTGITPYNEGYLFEIETENCDQIFRKLKNTNFNSTGRLISQSVFEYPLGKSIALADPSRNKFLLFEEY